MMIRWFVVLFPLFIFPWGSDPIFTYFKVIYLNLFVGLVWLFIVVNRKWWLQQVQGPFSKIDYLIVVFVSLLGISTLLSVDHATSILGTAGRNEGILTLLSYCSIFIFSYHLIHYQDKDKLLKGVVIIAIFVAIYGILQHYLLDFLPRSSTRIGYTRSFAFFGNPNFYGSYLVLVTMLAIPLFLNAISKRTYIVYLISIWLFVVNALFSNTRSSWVGLFIGFCFFTAFIVLRQQHLFKRWLTLVVTVVLLVIIIDFSEQGQYFNRMSDTMEDNYHVFTNQATGHEGSGRFYIWQNSVPLIKEYLWFGSGPDTFGLVFPPNEEEGDKLFNLYVDKAHNEYLQMAITFGVPALIVYLLLVYSVLRQAIEALRFISGNDYIIQLGLIAAILGYLGQAFFNISFVAVAPIFWALLGFTYGISRYYVSITSQEEKQVSSF